MNGHADVKSLQGLIDWHAGLSNFRQEALESISSIALEIQRAYDYLDDKLNYWKNRVRDYEQDVVQAKAELNRKQTPNFSGRMPDTSVEEENLEEAKKKLDHAHEQIRVVRHWLAHLPKDVNEAYESYARRYVNFLEGEVQHSLSALQQQIRSLEAYLNLQAATVVPLPETPKETP